MFSKLKGFFIGRPLKSGKEGEDGHLLQNYRPWLCSLVTPYLPSLMDQSR